MKTSHSLTRRAALGLAAGSALAALAPGSPAHSGAASVPPLAARTVRLFQDPRHAARLGRSCMRCSLIRGETPGELVEALFGPDRIRLERAGDGAVHDWLRARVRQDFSAGSTVRVEGWVLARTEALLYALAFAV